LEAHHVGLRHQFCACSMVRCEQCKTAHVFCGIPRIEGSWLCNPMSRSSARLLTLPPHAGWLLVIGFDAARGVSELVILDAANVAAGPVATADLPSVVPHALHGMWVPESDFNQSKDNNTDQLWAHSKPL
jgi:Retinal pigment epithelial membrane protein